ncbi:hypothetical protein T484DRAFT_1782266, partial [Baffinella frigidus]
AHVNAFPPELTHLALAKLHTFLKGKRFVGTEFISGVLERTGALARSGEFNSRDMRGTLHPAIRLGVEPSKDARDAIVGRVLQLARTCSPDEAALFSEVVARWDVLRLPELEQVLLQRGNVTLQGAGAAQGNRAGERGEPSEPPDALMEGRSRSRDRDHRPEPECALGTAARYIGGIPLPCRSGKRRRSPEGVEQSKEVAGLPRAGGQTRQLQDGGGREAPERDVVVRSSDRSSMDLVLKNEVARLRHAGEEVAGEHARDQERDEEDLCHGEAAPCVWRLARHLQASEERSRAERAAMGEELHRARPDQETEVAAKDAELQAAEKDGFRRARDEHARELHVIDERVRAEVAAKDGEIARLLHAGAQQEKALAASKADLAAKGEEDERCRARQGEAEQLQAKEVAATAQELLRARGEQTGELEAMQNEIDRLRHTGVELARELEGKTKEIAELRRDKAEQGAALAASKDKLAAKDGKIEFLRRAGEQLETAVAASKAEVAAKQEELCRVRQDLGDQETALAVKETEVAAKQEEIARGRYAGEQLEAALAAKEGALAATEEDIAELRRERAQQSTEAVGHRRAGELQEAALVAKDDELRIAREEQEAELAAKDAELLRANWRIEMSSPHDGG